MRHGRKSRSKRFDGYKEHIARPRRPGDRRLRGDPRQSPGGGGCGAHRRRYRASGLRVAELHIDRAYVNSPLASSVLRGEGDLQTLGFDHLDLAFSRRPTSASISVQRPSRVLPERSNPSSPAKRSTSTRRPVARARCARTAPRRRRGAASPSPMTSRSSDDFVDCSGRLKVASGFVPALPSSMRSLTSPPARATGPATSVRARTCSISGAPPQSRISRRCNRSTERPRRWRTSDDFQPVRRSSPQSQSGRVSAVWHRE